MVLKGKRMLEKIKSLIQKNRQFLLYCVVGASNTLITWAVSFLLVKAAGLSGTVASFPAYAAGIVNGYIWSTRAVFKAKGTMRNFSKFIAVNVLMIALNYLLVLLFEGQLRIDGFVSQVLATPFTFVGNFVLNKYWTFQTKK